MSDVNGSSPVCLSLRGFGVTVRRGALKPPFASDESQIKVFFEFIQRFLMFIANKTDLFPQLK
jgi:hypothetical protein